MPLLWISLSFLIGLILGAYLPWTLVGWCALAVLALVLWPAFRFLPDRGRVLHALCWLGHRESRLFVPPLLLAAFLFFGAARMVSSAPDTAQGHIAGYNDNGKFRVTGVLVAPPDKRDRSTLLRMEVEEVTPLDEKGKSGPAQPAHGLLLALLPPDGDWEYGDRLELDGTPVTPPEGEDFSYRDYLARQDVYSYLAYPRARLLDVDAASPLMAAIYRVRDWALAEVFHLFPAPEAPLLAGILLGVESGMPDSLSRAFQDTGTAHVIAISGFNIAILAQLFSNLFSKALSRWWAMIAAILAIAGYTILVGATPSVVRAAIMGSMALVADQLGRRTTGANSIAFTAMLMSLQNPHLPWDPSFQLSFGATLGLILYGDRFQSGFTRFLEKRMAAPKARQIAAPVGEYVLMTLAAQLMTLPVILYHFQRLSLSSLLANPLILPPQPLVMVFSGLAVLVGAVSDPLAHVLAWLAWPLSAYTNRLVELLASIPGGVLVLGEMGLGTVVLMYVAALAPLWKESLPGKLRQTIRPATVLTGMALLTAILWRAVFSAPDGRLHLMIFDIQGSQVLLVRAPQGETLLINGGPSGRLLDDALGRWLSPFDRRLDALLLNDSRTSAFSGLPAVLDRYPPGQLFWGCAPPETRVAEGLVEQVQNSVESIYAIKEEEALNIGSAARLSVRAAGKEGSALLLTMGNFRALVPGGTPLERISRDDLDSLSLLILDSRDMKNASPEAWLAVNPRLVITTPDPGIAPPYGPNWFNTHPQGWYAITTNGEQMWLEQK